MDIRPAAPDDVPAVLPMVARVCAFHQKLDPVKFGYIDNPEAMYSRWLSQRAGDPRSVFLVADAAAAGEAGPRLAAFLVATVEPEVGIYVVEEYGFIHDVWVEPDYRNEGLGRQLVMAAVAAFREIGVAQVRLDTAAANDVARKLFEACGFRASVTEMLRVTE